ncbi:hypothetical protein N0V83_009989 [Neocucurbitaria cava]|uniref:Uncharacterized protein n=1 Tax=Neocucurbitaria cava TaxID=798079 RepID=A0A9W8Y0C9_9PLEO|nr:hypothetical protein N0V83_009989 [Neocucurbitaria cava]
MGQLSPVRYQLTARKHRKTATAPTNDELLGKLVFTQRLVDRAADVNRRNLHTSAAKTLRSIKGNDVQQNPRWKWFYQVEDSDQARLLGGDHLIDVKPTDQVDWEDGNRVDRKNASPAMLQSLIEQERLDQQQDPELHTPPNTAKARGKNVLGSVPSSSSPAGSPAVAGARGEVPEEEVDLDEEVVVRNREFDTKRWKVLHKLTQFDGTTADAMLRERGMEVEGIDAVAEETGQEVDTNMDKIPEDETGATKTNAKFGVDDTEFRRRQKEVMGTMAEVRVKMEEYKEALNGLHIEKRTVPRIPGQHGDTLIWNQTVGAYQVSKAAIKRGATGKGMTGKIVCDDTGLGKTNLALGAILAVSTNKSYTYPHPGFSGFGKKTRETRTQPTQTPNFPIQWKKNKNQRNPTRPYTRLRIRQLTCYST